MNMWRDASAIEIIRSVKKKPKSYPGSGAVGPPYKVLMYEGGGR